MLNSGKQPDLQDNNNKKWSEAMERYNLPTGGIEVIISGSGSSHSHTEPVNAQAPSTVLERVKPPVARKRRPGRYFVTRALVLIGTFAVIGNIPVYSKIAITADQDNFEWETLLESEIVATSVTTGADRVADLNLPVAPITYAGHEKKIQPDVNSGNWELHKVANGESLAEILTPMNLKTTIEELTQNEAVHRELQSLRTDKKVLVQINANREVEQLIYATGKRKAYIVSRQKDGYAGKWDNNLFEEQHNRIAFTIRNPFHYEAKKAGLPNAITRQLVKIFKPDIDFRRLNIGDQASVIFEDYYFQGERVLTDKVLASEFTHRSETHQRILFVANDGDTLYLKPNDDLALKEVAFNRYPLKQGRLASGFGMRHHPVLRKRRMHSGADFAAPRGTPIHATSDGKVIFVGRKGAYGKSIELRHDGGITTRYGHMSKYKTDLPVGAQVKRGDVIGYVGSTGRSTGNHVHYEFHIDGKPHNPMTVKLPTRGVLTAKEMKDFKRLSKNMSYQLIKLRDTAAIERNARQQFGG